MVAIAVNAVGSLGYSLATLGFVCPAACRKLAYLGAGEVSADGAIVAHGQRAGT